MSRLMARWGALTLSAGALALGVAAPQARAIGAATGWRVIMLHGPVPR